MESNRKFLIDEVDKWIKDEVITKEQGEKIKSRYQIVVDDRIVSSDRFSSIFTSIGALLISLAALIFFGSNFAKYSFPMQVFILFLGIILFYVLSIYFDKKFHRTSLAFYFIANICASVAFFFFADKIYNKVIPNLSSIQYLQSETPSPEYLSMVRYSNSIQVATLAAAGVLTTATWIINANIKKFKLLSLMSSIAIPFSFFMFFQYIYLVTTKDKYFNGDPIYFILIGIIMAIFAYYLQRRGYFAEAIYYIVGLLLIFIGLTISSETGTIIGNAAKDNLTLSKGFWIIIFTAVSIVSIWYGVKSKKDRFLNIGLLFIGIDILLRYVDWFWDAMPKTLFFLIGGIVMLLVGIYFDRIKKKFINLLESH